MSEIFSIFYDADGYDISRNKIMGRQAAGNSFIKALWQHCPSNKFSVYIERDESFKALRAQLLEFSGSREVEVITPRTMQALAKVGAMFYPGPDFSRHAYSRAGLSGEASWSLVGVTHTTSSASAMDAMCDLLVAPIKPWDALICTSHAVKENVVNLLENESERLRKHFGAQHIGWPQLPVIPLGINCKSFEMGRDQKQYARKSLGIPENAFVVLYLGRLSFHAKANPFPMYKALQQLASLKKDNVVLVECGWFDNEYIEKAFKQASTTIAPDIDRIVLNGADKNERHIAWSIADVFCSLSDNIQETFGITPIEAMAAGLPGVVTDWNGYRETVRHGIDGFRIEASMPASNFGNWFAQDYALGLTSYDRYIGYIAGCTSLDYRSLYQSFSMLFHDRDLRHRMSINASKRARQVYDWRVVVSAYRSLLDELNFQREKSKALNEAGWPRRPNPLEAFSHYPTQSVSEDFLVRISDEVDCCIYDEIKTYRELEIFKHLESFLLNSEHIIYIFDKIRSHSEGVSIREITSQLDGIKSKNAVYSIFWMAKVGLISIGKNK